MCVVEAEKLTRRRHMGGKIKTRKPDERDTNTHTHTQKGAVLSFCLSPKKKGIEMKKIIIFLVFCVNKKETARRGGFPSRKLIEIKRKEKRTFFTVINVQHVPVFFFFKKNQDSIFVVVVET